MKQTLLLLAISIAAALVSSCAGQEFEQGPPPPVQQEFVSDNDYKLGVGDKIHIQVWRNDELSSRIPIRPDGKISSPLVGDIVAAGLTAEELGKVITARLTNYLKNPEVTVIVDSPVSSDFLRRVRVTGAVKNPTSLNYTQGMSVIDVVLQSGGLTEFSAGNSSRLYRKIDGKTKVYRLKLNNILEKGDLSTNYPLAPSDVITVPERNF